MENLLERLFDEVRNTFFAGKVTLSTKEWHAFQVILGVRIIESLSPLSNAFHNTCKDAIDRAAVFFLVRRYLHLMRNDQQKDNHKLWEIFVDYVKRAVAAKLQPPLKSRHKIAEETLEILEAFSGRISIDYGTDYEIVRDRLWKISGKPGQREDEGSSGE